MSELNLPACPICQAPGNLVRQTRTMQDQTYTWYECQSCRSVLLSLGNDKWAYQKIGIEGQSQLLKKPLGVAELRDLLPTIQPLSSVAPVAPAAQVGQQQAKVEEPPPAQHPTRANTPPTGRKASSRLVVGAIAFLGLATLLVVSVVVVKLLLGNGAPASVPAISQATQTRPATYTPLAPTDTPTPRPTATWVPTFTPIAPTPTPTLDPQFLRGLDAIQSEVTRIRGLEQTQPISRTFLNHQELFAQAQHWVETEYEPGELETEARTLAAFGFIPRNYDLRRSLVAFYASQVAGFYDSKADTLYVVSNLRDNELPPVTQMAFAHEYAHGLEDQHFDLDTFLNVDQLNQDRQLARQALVEGSATVLMNEYYLALDMTDEELMDILLQALSSDGDALSSMPGEIASMVMFPYTEGASFVLTLYENGGWKAVNAAYADPPQSTEQILHPEKYLAREEPANVSLPPLADTLGGGWSLVKTDTLGEHQLSLYLNLILSDTAAITASEGWDGDCYALYASGDDDVLVLATAWDSAAERDEFVKAYEQFAAAKYGQPASGTQDAEMWWAAPHQAAILSWSDTHALIVIAPDMDTADRILKASRYADKPSS
jgi:hypothetical protein